MKKLCVGTLLLAGLTASPVHAKLKVFACEPEWGSLVQELGGDKVEVDVATSALQDVHQIDAKPSLIAKVRRADLLVCSGADLEVGWLPQLIRQSGNPRIAGGPGYFMAADQVVTLEKPDKLDWAAGDLHPQGNPHIHLDPWRVLTVAKALSGRLAQLDGVNAASYRQQEAAFTTRWQAAIQGWEKQAAPLKGKKVVVYHISWTYLLHWLGMEQVGALESKPGVPPTSAYLSGLIGTTKSQGVYAIIQAAYQNPKPAVWLSERTQVPAITLPFTVGGDPESKDLFSLYDDTIKKLLTVGR